MIYLVLYDHVYVGNVLCIVLGGSDNTNGNSKHGTWYKQSENLYI